MVTEGNKQYMDNKKRYMEYLIKIQNKIVILSTILSDLYNVKHDDFIYLLKDNIKIFPPDSILFYNKGNLENYKNVIVAALTKQGVAMLHKLYSGDNIKEININIIKSMNKMGTINETKLLKEEIDLLSQQKSNSINDYKNQLRLKLQDDLKNTTENLFKKFESIDKFELVKN